MSTVTQSPQQVKATMNEQPEGLVKRVTQLAATLPASAVELVERIRAIRAEAHVLSPAVTAASIPPHIRINTVVEVIDTSFDPKTGRGNDVYFQASIHKSDKRGEGFVPLEVSLNATCIKRMLAAAGVSVTHSDEIPTGAANWWKWQSRGKMRDFDGSWRELPPGTAEIDLRDGSAQIGEFTAEEWKKREAEAAQRAKDRKLADKDLWKEKPKPIGGWTADRVMSARRFGLRLAEAKSLNALGRNFGLKQVYSLEELKKPFVIFRATFAPDMADPAIKQMVTAAELGATNLLGFPSAPALPPAAVQAPEPDPHVVEGDVVAEPQQEKPADTSVLGDQSFGAVTEPAPTFNEYTVKDAGGHKEGGFYVETTAGLRLLTDDESAARAAHGSIAAKKPIYVEEEKRQDGAVWIVELRTEKPDEGRY